jgi:hypothetical protein
MAKYRAVYQKIWKDPDFQAYSPESKLVFIYLITNESTTESGIYPITIATISNETGVGSETVSQQLANGFKNVAYDITNHVIFIKKFRVYNAGGKPTLIARSIVNDFKLTRNSPLWSEFITLYPEFEPEILTVGKPLANGSGKIRTKGNPSTKGNPNTNPKGKGNEPLQNSYGEFKNVFLTDEEHKKLVERFGEADAEKRIENLSQGMASKGYRYKSHYATILSWKRREDKEVRNHGAGKPGPAEGNTGQFPRHYATPEEVFGKLDSDRQKASN